MVHTLTWSMLTLATAGCCWASLRSSSSGISRAGSSAGMRCLLDFNLLPANSLVLLYTNEPFSAPPQVLHGNYKP